MVEQKLQAWLAEARSAVFFGGAGVSTESGIPDFRSGQGLYGHTPEYILSHTFFFAETAKFYEFYKANLLHLQAQPNKAHRALAKLEAEGRLKGVITQNIDGLHQAAGSQRVIELHGTVHKNRCLACGKRYGVEVVVEAAGVPTCACGGLIKPEVVLYEEGLPAGAWQEAVRLISEADLLLVGGTSLVVYPAAGLVEAYQGERLVLINKGATPLDSRADLVINEPIGEVLGRVVGL